MHSIGFPDPGASSSDDRVGQSCVASESPKDAANRAGEALGCSTSPAYTGKSAARVRVAVVYHIWPHYRLPLMKAMDASMRVEWTFLSSGEPFEGIPHADTSNVHHFVKLRFYRMGGLIWQFGAISTAMSSRYDAVILLADPHFVLNWVAAPLARMFGKSTFFWGHGWQRHEASFKSNIRSIFYRLANRLLVYSERGRNLGVLSGFPADRVSVVYNSLDVSHANNIVARIEAGTLHAMKPRALFTEPGRPLLICTARITLNCRFDLLLSAASKLAATGRPVNVLLVGDGPERAALTARAEKLGINVYFYGDCYDEEIIGQLIYHADLTVSPGKIGLTAMHSLMYGTPAITHGNLDAQMPEVEAIEPGMTGLLFRQDDADDLADSIVRWLDSAPDRGAVRRAARRVIAEKWNPDRQAAILENAVLRQVGTWTR